MSADDENRPTEAGGGKMVGSGSCPFNGSPEGAFQSRVAERP